METTKLKGLRIRPLQESDLPEVVRIEHQAWHEYYQQYPLYQLIKDSVTEKILFEDWRKFLTTGTASHTSLVVGDERKAYIALLDGDVVGVGAVSSYVEGRWPPVDELLRGPDGKVRKTAKFQELYIKPEMRRHGVGRYLSLARADYMLSRGYSALFLTTYADAYKTNEYHLKNGLKLVHEYMSIQTFANGERAKIACFLEPDLKAFRDRILAALAANVEKGKALPLADRIL